LKLFYRPADLPGSAAKAPEKLAWHVVAGEKGARLDVHNPTPYYITFSSVSLAFGGATHETSKGMVAPFDDLALTIKNFSGSVPVGATIKFETINDFGAVIPHQSSVTQ